MVLDACVRQYEVVGNSYIGIICMILFGFLNLTETLHIELLTSKVDFSYQPCRIIVSVQGSGFQCGWSCPLGVILEWAGHILVVIMGKWCSLVGWRDSGILSISHAFDDPQKVFLDWTVVACLVFLIKCFPESISFYFFSSSVWMIQFLYSLVSIRCCYYFLF